MEDFNTEKHNTRNSKETNLKQQNVLNIYIKIYTFYYALLFITILFLNVFSFFS